MYCSINFKLEMMIPLTVRYDLESKAIILPLKQCPYIHFNYF